MIATAEGHLWFGVAENGRTQEFAAGLEALDHAQSSLQAAEIADAERTVLALRIEALREDLAFSLKRSRHRFYGAFPLARLVIAQSTAFHGRDVTETTRRLPALEAVKRATERVISDIIRLQYPHVVLRSDPPNRAFETEALREFSRANRPFVHSRAQVIEALSIENLAAFDRGEIDAGSIARLMEHLNAAKLLVVTIRQNVDLRDAVLIEIHGDFYETGADRPTDSFSHLGFSRGRRSQLGTIIWAHAALLAVALLLAGVTSWNHTEGPSLLQRAMASLFLFGIGRVFAFLAIFLLGKIVPGPDWPAVGAAWWPGIVAMVLILGAGFVAWIAQARMSHIVPGSRTSREVGMIFGMGALGATAYFIEPLVMLEPDRGVSAFIPLALASCLLSVLTGYSIRTGPPVPRSFLVGPILVTPFIGLALFAVLPDRLWMLAGVSLFLCAAAAIRHQYAVAHGLEEAKVDETEAGRTDDEILDQIGEKIEKKFPI